MKLKLSVFVLIMFAITSCGTGNNFSKSKSRSLKKVRSEQHSVSSDRSEQSSLNVSEIESKQPAFEINQTIETPSDNIEPDAEELLDIDSTTTLTEEITFAELFKQTKVETSQVFNDNHFGTLSTYLGGLIAGAIGYRYFNAIAYILSFTLFCAAFVLALMMKYKLAAKEKSAESEKKYKRRLWFANFVFYTSFLVILLTLIAFLVILV